MLLLLEALHPAPTLDLYRAVLFHDLHERWIGDLPGHLGFTSPGYYAAKRKAEETTNKRFDLAGPDLVGEEARWLSALDKIEFYMWCHDQLNFGNDHVSEALESTERWIEDNRARLPEPVRQFLESYEWERTNMR
jgi:5'-deoxynucleotidase YfbR-like HD superfamily hydrolase